VDGVLTRLFATHANILTSKHSSVPHGYTFSAFGTLPYRPAPVFKNNLILKHTKNYSKKLRLDPEIRYWI